MQYRAYTDSLLTPPTADMYRSPTVRNPLTTMRVMGYSEIKHAMVVNLVCSCNCHSCVLCPASVSMESRGFCRSTVFDAMRRRCRTSETSVWREPCASVEDGQTHRYDRQGRQDTGERLP